jgi:hypothetical protein
LPQDAPPAFPTWMPTSETQSEQGGAVARAMRCFRARIIDPPLVKDNLPVAGVFAERIGACPEIGEKMVPMMRVSRFLRSCLFAIPHWRAEAVY